MMLCPNCPFRNLWDRAKKNLMEKQFIKGLKEEPGVLKICIEVRRMAEERGQTCRYFRSSLGQSRVTTRSRTMAWRSLDEFASPSI